MLFLALPFTYSCKAQNGQEATPYAHALRLFQERAFQESEDAFGNLLNGSRNAPPYTRLKYLSGALELFTFTLEWGKALSLVEQANQIIKSHPAASHEDSLQLAIYHYRLGDLGFRHSYPSKDKPTRLLSLKAFQKSLTEFPGNHPHKAALHRKIGMILRWLHDTDSAYAHFRLAVELADSMGDKPEMVRSKQALGNYFYYEGYSAFRLAQGDKLSDPQVELSRLQARAQYGAARRLLSDPTTIGFQPEDSIVQFIFEGLIYKSLYGATLRAVNLFQQADAIAGRRETFSYYERVLYNSLGFQYSERGQYLKALASYRKTEAVLKKHPVYYKEWWLLYESMGNTWGELGDPYEALPYYQQAHSIIAERFKVDSSLVQKYAISLTNIASCFLELGEEEQFLDSAWKALDKFAEVPDSELELSYPARAFSNYGYVLMKKERYMAALDSFNISNSLLEQVGPSALFSISTNHAYIANCKYELGDEAAGRDHIALARSYLEVPDDPDPIDFGEAGNQIAAYYAKAGRLDEALELCHRVIWKLGSAPQAENYADSPSAKDVMERELALEALKIKAKVLVSMANANGDLPAFKQALQVHGDAVEMIHIARQQQSAQASKTDFSGKSGPIFESSLEVAWQLYKTDNDPQYLEKAFDFAEQSRGMVLLAAVSTKQAAAAAGVPDSLLLVQRNFQAQADRLRRLKNAGGSQKTTELWNAQLVRISAKQDSLQTLLKAKYQKYYEQVYETQTVTIPEIQALLRAENRALVEYFYGDSLLFTFAVTADTFIVQRELITEAFSANLDTVQTALAHRQGNSKAKTYARASYKVYDFLLGDLGIQLPEKLLIVPDGRLNFLSFDALTTSPPPSHKLHFNHLSFLLFEHMVSYDYSFTIRERRGVYNNSAKPNVLAMAPSFDSSGLQELPVAHANVQNLHDKFSSVRSIFGKEATEDFFRREAHNYAVIDLATHGKMDSLNSADCRLHFSKDSLNDGKLHLGEIYSMDLNARMAVLEACESGLGPNARGEGVMSLARGFSYAGCHTIVTSLWNVADEDITLQIIGGFYENLSEKMPVDEALTLAKRKYLSLNQASPGARLKFFQPFYWAEMIVIGDTTPIPLEKVGWQMPNELWWILLMVLLLAGSLIFVFRKSPKTA